MPIFTLTSGRSCYFVNFSMIILFMYDFILWKINLNMFTSIMILLSRLKHNISHTTIFSILIRIISQNLTTICISCPRTFWLNGRVECNYKHILDVVCTHLTLVFYLDQYWLEASHTIIYIINHTLSPTIGNISPCDRLYSCVPNYILLWIR